MLHLTQLIYIHEGQEEAFLEFESKAIPLMKKHQGEMLLRVRPTDETLIEGSVETPYEIHYMTFPSESDLEDYLQDEERQKYLHLKDQSIRSTVLVAGDQV